MKEETKTRLAALSKLAEEVALALRAETSEALSTNDPIAVVKHFDDLRDAVDQIKVSREALADMADSLSTRDIPTLFSNKDLKTITIEGVGRVTVSYRFSASLVDKEKGFKWLRDNGHKELITETVNSSTLSGFAKDMLQNKGVDLPDDIFKISTNPYTSITKR